MTPNIQQSSQRLCFIDSLRGLTSFAVLISHLYGTTPIGTKVMASWMHPALKTVFENLHSGVEIFFVISGFVVAYALKDTLVNFRSTLNFLLRRYIRLSPPYWFAVIFSVLTLAISNIFLQDRAVVLPDLQKILINCFFLQDLLQVGHIVGAAWTLCLEVQFYLFFILFMAAAQYWSRTRSTISSHLLIFLPISVISVLTRLNLPKNPIPGFFIDWWYMFFLGVILCWVKRGQIQDRWFFIYLALISTTLVFDFRLADLIVIITGIIFFVAIKRDKLNSWLNFKWLLYLGSISYSLYLIHGDTGSRFLNIVYRIGKNNHLIAAVGFLLAILVSVLAAQLLYRLIEKPSIKLSRKFRLKAGEPTELLELHRKG